MPCAVGSSSTRQAQCVLDERPVLAAAVEAAAATAEPAQGAAAAVCWLWLWPVSSSPGGPLTSVAQHILRLLLLLLRLLNRLVSLSWELLSAPKRRHGLPAGMSREGLLLQPAWASREGLLLQPAWASREGLLLQPTWASREGLLLQPAWASREALLLEGLLQPASAGVAGLYTDTDMSTLLVIMPPLLVTTPPPESSWPGPAPLHSGASSVSPGPP